MDSHDLRTILRRNRVMQGIFLDVFALDHLPTAIELKGANRWFLVCNCCPSTERGRHWIAIFYDRGSIEFFDSFALPPHTYDARLVTFLHHTSGACEVIYNNEPLQSINSDVCGYYCILFGVARSRGVTFRNIVQELIALTRDNLVKFIVKTLL